MIKVTVGEQKTQEEKTQPQDRLVQLRGMGGVFILKGNGEIVCLKTPKGNTGWRDFDFSDWSNTRTI